MIFDDAYVYQHDGLNRLIQVNQSGYLCGDNFDVDSRLIRVYSGGLVTLYVYDGVDRLIQGVNKTGFVEES